MQFEVGSIVEGKVNRITKFGAFVELEPGKTGMVHISEVANSYVNDINDFLQEGQTVKVKILSISEDGKIALSIKKTLPPPQKRDFRRDGSHRDGNHRDGGHREGGAPREGRSGAPRSRTSQNNRPKAQYYSGGFDKAPTGNQSFDDMLSRFMASSDEKLSGIKKNHEVSRRGGGSRRR